MTASESGRTFAFASMPSSTGSEHPDHGRDRSPEGDEVVDAHAVPDTPRPTPNPRLNVDVRGAQSRYVSQLPHPDDLERYKQLIPDSPERMLAAGEREQEHRHQLENRLAAIDEAAMPKFYAAQRRGQILGVVAALAYLGLMLVIVLKGQPALGVVGAGGGAAALVWAVRRDPDGSVPEAAPSSGNGEDLEEEPTPESEK